ncbi:flagellar filament capping protein FliD [Blastochloris viridis]|uniref:Flagellar hook-associated protein 2 n=1 Tax=Blastochloris viridis TaxID=1079 RepID=A0A0H5BE70_BLAVI|nr:flagellar filament capping protein FliD [Blastochloris viridis]ALK08088.1 Flagellar hook-associated protein 2 [Blastochloris viridis]BAR98651.1 flagellar hook-associated protein FliD [Blastochloris viridis]CUU44010.1 Flagellar cap protein [Blastochloris viridis]
MSTISSTSSSTSSTYSSSALNSDWSALIEEVVAAKLVPADTLETKITKNDTKISAYEELQSLLSDISDAAYVMSAPSGYLAKSDDIFNSRTSYLSTTGSYDAGDVLGVAVDSSTDLGTYDIQIQQVATAHKVSSKTVTSKDDDLGYTGTFTLGVEGGTAVTIDVSSTTSLSELATAINASTSTSGVKATVLKVSDSSYQLVLTASDTGKAITASTASGDDVLGGLEILDSSGDFKTVLQEAKDAIISIDGVTITRDSNTISDALSGVTLYLYGTTTTGTSIAVEVGTDLTSIADTIQSLVDAYNAYREFVITQQATAAGGGAAESAVLFGDSTLRQVNSDIMDALNTMIDDNTMALLGLSFDSSNNLVLDTTTLQDALLENLDEVKALLTFSFESSSSELGILARGSSAPSSFTLDITVDGSGNVTSASVGGDSSLFTISGTSIKGATGTAYEGFTFLFLGDASESINVTLGYGLADKLNNAVTTASEDSIQTVIDNLTEKNSDYEDDISTIEDRAEALRERLTARYAKYQAAIAQAESTLAYLKAMLDASSSD